MGQLLFVHFMYKNVDIVIFTYMNKINEATFKYSSLKKDRRGAFETDEGGSEKHFFFA